MAKDINISCTCLQDKQGNPVSAQHAKAIQQLMLSSFHQLEMQGLAPESIGQASLQVLHWLTHTLQKQFLELHLCADNWKSMKLMIDNYSQWYNYHVKKRGTKCTKSKDIPEDIPPAGDELHESSVDSLAPMINPLLQEPPMKKQKLENTKSTTSEALLQLEIPLPPAETNNPALLSLSLENKKQTETLNVEVKNPLADFVFKPTTMTSSTPTPFSSGASSIIAMPPRPSRMLPSVADVALLAIKMELVATENTIMTTANMNVNTKLIKKQQPSLKPMQVGPKITPHNICVLDWQTNGHQWELASAFALYWDNLSASIKEEYKRKATA
ncbi:hypothetical protein DFH29DRAFT_1005155 [Suillus ampliporus]|nr:hypothetical protein DFH29DRAFT_1005155 [Suillus ampliporus]